MERENLNTALSTVQYSSFPQIFAKFRELAAEYGSLPFESLVSAFGNIGAMYTPNAYIQNNRVKGISTRPANYDKDKVADMLKAPEGNEQPLRQVAHGLEISAYPFFNIRSTYQNLLTYHNYFSPSIGYPEDYKQKDFWREYMLLEKLRIKMNPKALAHEAAGIAMLEGKCFYHPRVSVDKPHNKINHAFVQQLPSDWCKIVGFNNISRYTVAFNMMYFLKAGTTPTQFGDLFDDYLGDFNDVIYPAPVGVGKRIVYAEKSIIDMTKFNTIRPNAEVYYQNGRWFYWVTLPVDEVFTFEIDDVNKNVFSPFTGLFVDMIQLSQLEAIQLSLLQNPLVSLLHGEIETYETKETNTEDQYKLSNAGIRLFEAMWYKMLAENNTNGIGLYMAPLRNMKLESLAEAPSAMDIVSKGYTDTMAKAGLTAIIPTTADSRAGAAQISFKIASQFPKTIYTCTERMMNAIAEKIGMKYEFRFKMFGDLATDEARAEELRKAMTLGILSATLEYDALKDISLFEDITISDVIFDSGVLNKRIPLVSTYSAKQEVGLPPQPEGYEAQTGEEPEVGRPSSEGEATSDGQENDIDSIGE